MGERYRQEKAAQAKAKAEEARRQERKEKLAVIIAAIDQTVEPGRVLGNRPGDLSGAVTAENWWRMGGGNSEMSEERVPYQAAAIARLEKGQDFFENLEMLCKNIGARAGAVEKGLEELSFTPEELAALRAEQKAKKSFDFLALEVALTAMLDGEDAANRLARIMSKNFGRE